VLAKLVTAIFRHLQPSTVRVTVLMQLGSAVVGISLGCSPLFNNQGSLPLRLKGVVYIDV